MKIVLNAASAKMGGAATYIKNLARELAALSGSDEFIFCVPEAQACVIDGVAPNVRVIKADLDDAPFWRRMWFEQVTLRRFLKMEGADLLYSTANFGMWSAPCPQALLVRNALPFSKKYSETILPHLGRRSRLGFILRRWLICRSVGWADVVMTPTQSMLDDLRRFVGGNAEKFAVYRVGAPVGRFRNNGARRAGVGREGGDGVVRLLHVSYYADHKNMGVLFEALDVLQRTGLPDVVLSTTADVSDPRCPVSYYREKDLALLQRPVVRERVRVLGDVPYGELPALYHAHDVFVFPSMTESYGHPLVEAMASGLPIVASDTPSNREVCGDAALYFDLFSAEDLGDKIRRLSADTSLREQLREKALLRAEEFNSLPNVERLLGLFKRMAGRDA
jgi:glycosyltransferase involved in cell wall biosynthesis